MNEQFARAAAATRVDLSHEPDFTLGRLEIRPSLREIAGVAWRESVDPRVMRVLVALARAKGRIVSRDDLIESCWDGVIVGEDAINKCISRLRRVAEVSGNAFSIETIARVGYGLKIADVINAPEPGARARSRVPPFPVASSVKQFWTAHAKWMVTVSAVLLTAAGFMVWRLWSATPAAGPAASAETSVAVLPFVNMSGDPGKDYVSDGFSEELVNDLSNDSHLRVVSRTSSFAFKGRNQDIETIARALRVHAIVEGSVRESGDRVRITAQLINGSDGYHLWSADYTRSVTDILSLQDELARAIASALTHQLVPSSAALHPKIDPAVYRLYLEGIHDWNTLAPPQRWSRTLQIFRQVSARAPDFPDGFAWLSLAAANLAVNEDAAPASDFAVTSDAAQRALSLDPRNMMARFARFVVEISAWNWRTSASDLRALRKENPNSYFSIAGVQNYYSNLGFADEALAAWRRLFAIDPRKYDSSQNTLWALYGAGRLQEDIGAATAILVKQPYNGQALLQLCIAYAETGRIKDARVLRVRLHNLPGGDASQGCEWYVDFFTGNLSGVRNILHVWEAGFPDGPAQAGAIGVYYVTLGDFDKASDWFERAYERRESTLFVELYSKGFGVQQAAFEKYRMTARYRALVQKPLFREWQAEHDRIAAALAAHRDPLN